MNVYGAGRLGRRGMVRQNGSKKVMGRDIVKLLRKVYVCRKLRVHIGGDETDHNIVLYANLK